MVSALSVSEIFGFAQKGKERVRKKMLAVRNLRTAFFSGYFLYIYVV